MKQVYLLFFCMFFLININVTHADLNEGLIAYYPFNNNADDISGNELHGSVNGALLSDDRFGNSNSAYYFDGIDDYIVISSNESLDITGSFTFIAWVNVSDSTNDHQIVLSKWYKGCVHNRSYVLEFHPNGKTLQIPVGGGISTDNYSNAFSEKDISFDEWYFIVAMYDMTSIKIFINGEQTCSLTTSGTIPKTDTLFYIGRHECTTDKNTFYGKIDDIRIYNRALSIDEIDEIYNDKNEQCNYYDSDNDGVINLWDKCSDTPVNSYVNKNGCKATGLYTEDQMNQMVSSILLWGDTNGDNKINLIEAIKALRVTSGVTEPSVK